MITLGEQQKMDKNYAGWTTFFCPPEGVTAIKLRLVPLALRQAQGERNQPLSRSWFGKALKKQLNLMAVIHAVDTKSSAYPLSFLKLKAECVDTSRHILRN